MIQTEKKDEWDFPQFGQLQLYHFHLYKGNFYNVSSMKLHLQRKILVQQYTKSHAQIPLKMSNFCVLISKKKLKDR